MSAWGPLLPMDLALLSPDPSPSPRFFTFRGKFDAWRCVDGGPSRESAKHLACEESGCGYAFTAERLAITDAPWPTAVMLPPPTYLLRAHGGFVVAVPHLTGDRAPRKEPVVFMNVIATPADEPAGRALLQTLGVRAFLGRVHDIIDCGWLYDSAVSGEIGSLQWRAKS